MDIDVNTLRGISTILVMVAFLWLCVWAYSNKRKQEFTQAANLPFADDEADGQAQTEINTLMTKEGEKSE